MTEEELLNQNPWKDVELGLLYDSEPNYFCKDDEVAIKNFNASSDEDNKLILNIPPEPWQGNPLKAKVIFLSLNPGYIDNVNHKLAKVLQTDEHLLKQMMAFKRSTLDLSSNSFMPEENSGEPIGTKDAISMLGDWYWDNGFRSLREAVCKGKYTEKQFYRDVAIMQFHAYSSKKYERVFPRKRDTLKSQEFTRKLIEFISKNNPNTVFVIMRSSKKWSEFLGELSIKKIEKESNSMCQAISPNNLGEANFKELCMLLNSEM